MGSARLLALLDSDEASSDGHPHELLFGLRLQASSAEVHQGALAANSGVTTFSFVRPQNELETQAAEGLDVISLEDFLNRDGVSESLIRSLKLLRELRAAA